MPLQTKPEDYPAAVCFSIEKRSGFLQVTCRSVTEENQSPYRILGGSSHFADTDAFKARVIEAGMSPAVAEDPGRSFNATGRQLRALGFSIELTPKNGEG